MSKPRSDAEKILTELGFRPFYIGDYKEENKLKRNINRFTELLRLSKSMCKGDVFLVQHPAVNNTIFLKYVLEKMNKKGVITVALVHDLNIIRKENNMTKFEALSVKWKDIYTLKAYTKIVVHNESMKEKLQQWNIEAEKMVTLGVFDYLTEDVQPKIDSSRDVVTIAGNLKSDKAKYLYNLPSSPSYFLFGINYDQELANNGENVEYKGSFKAEEISSLQGKYGLIWDGNSTETCSGDFGTYLRYNNPYKLSMYLAAGMPVIIWDECAEKDFVVSNKVGIAVKGLTNLNNVLIDISDVEYQLMKENIKQISRKIREGFFLKKAIKAICDEII